MQKFFFLVLFTIVGSQVWGQHSPIQPYREGNYSLSEIKKFSENRDKISLSFKKKVEDNFYFITGEKWNLTRILDSCKIEPFSGSIYENSGIKKGEFCVFSDSLKVQDLFWTVRFVDEKKDTIIIPLVKARCMNVVRFPMMVKSFSSPTEEPKEVVVYNIRNNNFNAGGLNLPDMENPGINTKPKKPFFKRKGVIGAICGIGAGIIVGTVVLLSGGGGSSGGPGGSPTTP